MTNFVQTSNILQTANNTAAFDFSGPALSGDNLYLATNVRIVATGTGSASRAIDGTGSGDHFVEIQGHVLSFESEAIELGTATEGDNQVLVGEGASVSSADDRGIYLRGGDNQVSINGEVFGETSAVSTANGTDRVNISESGVASSTTGSAITMSSGNNILNNAGSIFSASSSAVTLSGGDNTIVNGGSITGELNGVSANSGNSTITNSGSISGGTSAVRMTADSTGGNNVLINTGSITAEDFQVTSAQAIAVEMENGNNHVTNDGVITSDDFGVFFEVQNVTSNVDYDSLANSGSITSGRTAVTADTANFQMVNSGEIIANATGIETNGPAADILNSGLLSTGGDAIVTGTGTVASDDVVTNTGIIAASGSGMNGSAAGSTYSNSGTISARLAGISSIGNTSTIDNSGEIVVENSAGIFALAADHSIYNSGTITTGDNDGIYAEGVSQQIINSGTIQSSDEGIQIGAGGGQLIINTETGIIAAESDGISVFGSDLGDTQIRNDGEISSQFGDGIVIDASGNDLVHNTGSIATQAFNANAVNLDTLAGETVTLLNQGSLISASVAVSADAGDDTVINSGSIFGDVNLGDGNDIYDGISSGMVLGRVNGGDDNDSLFGSTSDDDLRGDNQSDLIEGNGGNDDLLGGQGQDVLRGGEGNDRLFGQSNGDSLDGGAGLDRLNGGLANDTFIFKQGNDVDIIDDFANNGIEKIDLTDWAAADAQAAIDAAYQVGGQVRINFGDGDMLALNGITVADLDASDFIFA